MVPIDYFDTAAEIYGDRTALLDGDVRLSFRELRHMSEKLGGAIAALSPDSAPLPVGVLSPNDYRVMVSMLGIMRAGATIVPMHSRNSVEVNTGVLRRVQPKCVIYHSSAADDVARMRDELPSVRRWIVLDGPAGDVDSLQSFMEEPSPPLPDWGDISGNPDRPVFYWQTSGTTDAPKIVVDDCGTFDATLRVTRHLRPRTPNDPPPVVLTVAPLSHSAGCHAFTMLTLGATVVNMRTFDAKSVFEHIERHRVTDVWLPPTALALLLTYPDADRFDRSSLRRVALGASAVSPHCLRRAVALLGPVVSHTYSQIESGVVTHLDEATVGAGAADVHPERLSSAGSSLFINRFGIMSDDGRLLPAGEEGEIVVRGRAVKRYLDPEQTAFARRFGWHHTGDLGYVDPSGFLFVVGRKNDIIITNGFKVLGAEVERALSEMPEIHECAVVGAPDLLRGEAVKAIFSLRPGCSLSKRAVLEHCLARLPKGKAPTSVEQWPDLPKTAVGKIDKRKIRALVWAAPTQVA